MLPTNNRSRSRSRSRARVVSSRLPQHENETTKTDLSLASQSRARHDEGMTSKAEQHLKGINSLLNKFVPQPCEEPRRDRPRTRSRSRSRVCGGAVKVEFPERNAKTILESSPIQDAQVPTHERHLAVRPSPCPSFYSVPRILPVQHNSTPSRSMPVISSIPQIHKPMPQNLRKRTGVPVSPSRLENYGKKSCAELMSQTSSTQAKEQQPSFDATNDSSKSANFDFPPYQRSLQTTTMGQPQVKQDRILPDVEIILVPSSDEVAKHQPSTIAPLNISISTTADTARKWKYVDTRPARRIPLLGSPGRAQGPSESSKGKRGIRDAGQSLVESLMKNDNVPLPPKALADTCKRVTKSTSSSTEAIKNPETTSSTFTKSSTPKHQRRNNKRSSNKEGNGIRLEKDHDNGILENEIMSQSQDDDIAEENIAVSDNDENVLKFISKPVLETITSGSTDIEETNDKVCENKGTEDNTGIPISAGAKQEYAEIITATETMPEISTNEENPEESVHGRADDSSDSDEFLDASEDLRDIDSKPGKNVDKKKSWCNIV